MKTKLEREFLKLGGLDTWGGVRLIIFGASNAQGIRAWDRLRMRLGLWILPRTTRGGK